MSTKTLVGILLAGTVGLVIFLFVQLSSNPRKPISIGTPAAAAACTQGEDCLPDVNFIDTNGTAYTYKDLQGKVVVINFWATWCGPCLREIPDFSRAYEAYKNRGVVVLGILSSDNPSASELLNFQSDNDMSYPVVREDVNTLSAFGAISALPTTFVFDRAGKRVYSHRGPLKELALAAVLEPLEK